tara:strand:+ start:10988 stop:11485 length:498 start_codon:yes stop_codon:yes gene_type:complete
MNYLDIFLLLIIGWGGYMGFSKGLVKELASILGIILGVVLAKNYFPVVDKKLYVLFESEADFISLISALIIFLSTIMIFKIFANILTKFLKSIALGLLNRIVGALFGILKSTLVLCIIIFIFSKINNVLNVIEDSKIQSSLVYKEIERINKIILNKNYETKGTEE